MKRFALLFYGLLGLPLAMVALPVYVQIPNYYTTQLSLPLASTGLVLFFARLVDTIQDPYLGKVIDRIKSDNVLWYLVAGILLIAAFYGLWLPPDFMRAHETRLLFWLGLMLAIAYTAHSMLNIAYLTWGAGLVKSPLCNADTEINNANHGLLGAAGWREAFGLFGVVLASILPTWILQMTKLEQQDYLWHYCMGFAGLLGLAIWALLGAAPHPRLHLQQNTISFGALIQDKKFRSLALIYFFNSLSVSIPATLLLFFINDQIRAAEQTGLFLAAYFIAGTCGLPLWIKFAKKIGTAAAWQVSMLLAVCSFVGAAFLGSGDSLAFLWVCIVSGFVLGADLALPPVLLAENVSDKSRLGSYYGIWSLIAKLCLAFAGLSLPLLHLLGFQSNAHPSSVTSTSQLGLTVCYALLPCLCKLIAFQLLRKSRS